MTKISPHRTLAAAIITLSTIAATLTLAGPASAAKPKPNPSLTYTQVIVRHGGKPCHTVEVTGINAHGTIGGNEICGASRAFIRKSSGKTTVFKAPGSAALDTQLTGLASNGTSSLFTVNSKAGATYTSYLRSASGTFTKITVPEAGPGGSEVLAVNDSSEAVGVYFTATPKPTVAPFIYKKGVIKDFTLGIAGATDVVLTGVTDTGVLSGQYADTHHVIHGFIYLHGKATVVRVPGAPAKSKRGAAITNLATRNTFTGDIIRLDTTSGFLAYGGKFLSVKVPKAAITHCQGVNINRTVVGYYLTATGRVRGFVAHFHH